MQYKKKIKTKLGLKSCESGESVNSCKSSHCSFVLPFYVQQCITYIVNYCIYLLKQFTDNNPVFTENIIVLTDPEIICVIFCQKKENQLQYLNCLNNV